MSAHLITLAVDNCAPAVNLAPKERRNSESSGIRPDSSGFFVPGHQLSMVGRGRKHNTRKGNTARRLLSVSNLPATSLGCVETALRGFSELKQESFRMHQLAPGEAAPVVPTESLCGCGCGQRAPLASRTEKSRGWVKGEPIRFIRGHCFRGSKRGSDAIRWKGGRQITKHGYVLLWTPSGRKYEHRAIAEKALGRTLKFFSARDPRNEVVHHINGVRTDNRPENLLVCSLSYHVALHARLESSVDWPEFAVNPRSKGAAA